MLCVAKTVSWNIDLMNIWLQWRGGGVERRGPRAFSLICRNYLRRIQHLQSRLQKCPPPPPPLGEGLDPPLDCDTSRNVPRNSYLGFCLFVCLFFCLVGCLLFCLGAAITSDVKKRFKENKQYPIITHTKTQSLTSNGLQNTKYVKLSSVIWFMIVLSSTVCCFYF